MRNTIEDLAKLIPDMSWYQGKLSADISTGGHNPYQVKFPILLQYETVFFPAEYTPEEFTWEWIEEHVTPEALDVIFWDICNSYTSEWIDELEREYAITVTVEGRSGKHLVTDLTETSIMELTATDICAIETELKRIESLVDNHNVWEDVALNVYYNIYCTEEDAE